MTDSAPTHVLVIPGIHVSCASAFSGPLTHGFPAVTAFVGLMHALKRQLAVEGVSDSDLDLIGIAPVSHGYLERLMPASYSVSRFQQKRNILKANGSSESVIEEGYIDLNISLVFGVKSSRWQSNVRQSFAADVDLIQRLLSRMRFAGGSLFFKKGVSGRPWVADGPGRESDAAFERYRYRLLPGFCFRGRPDIQSDLKNRVDQGDFSSDFESFLSFFRRDYRVVTDGEVSNISGSFKKENWKEIGENRSGWLVPYVCGYADILPVLQAGSVENARSADVPVHLCESIYGIGEWLGPHRLSSVMQMLWMNTVQADDGVCLYHNCEPFEGLFEDEEEDA